VRDGGSLRGLEDGDGSGTRDFIRVLRADGLAGMMPGVVGIAATDRVAGSGPGKTKTW
jgi:hypothetical protein